MKSLNKLAILLASVVAARSAKQGLTRIESYRVNTTIESRFAQTSVFVDFVNELDCATILGLTLQLPLDSRVTAMSIESDNGCTWTGEVQALEKAIASFNQTASEGKPAALLSTWDSTNYAVQVSLPPMGTTSLEIRFEELLRRQQHQVPFQIPLSPGLAVNELIMDLYISEPESGVAEFDLDSPAVGSLNINRDANTATAHYEMASCRMVMNYHAYFVVITTLVLCLKMVSYFAMVLAFCISLTLLLCWTSGH